MVFRGVDPLGVLIVTVFGSFVKVIGAQMESCKHPVTPCLFVGVLVPTLQNSGFGLHTHILSFAVVCSSTYFSTAALVTHNTRGAARDSQ